MKQRPTRPVTQNPARKPPAKGEPRQDARREPGRSEGPGEERHSGQGSESALRQLRAWERRRASDRTAPGRDKPGA